MPTRPRVLVNMADLSLPAPPTPAPGPADPDETELTTGADAAARVTAPVLINGQGPYEFVVDTGANHSVLASEVAAPLDLPTAGRAGVHGIAGVEPAETVLVRSLTIGTLTSRRIRAPLLPKARLGADGLLGVDVLKNRRVLIDFQRNELRIGSSREPSLLVGAPAGRLSSRQPDPSLVVVPARQRFGQLIIIDADIGGQPVTAFLDSGSQNTVGNLALGRLLSANPVLAAQKMVVQLIGVTGQTVSGELFPIPPLRMGGLRIGNMSAVFVDLHVFDIWDLKDTPAILVGVDVMRHFRSIELDFGGKKVTFQTGPGARPIPAEAGAAP
ncbi:MAG: retroviral-like aspartic protease family protein [Phenylobacterium sp.]|uniref:retroviral-like aspartic protease family protein n=1 Tax=Phenylobacterium sp. TaxID=1871053 RepID=UPI002A360482|nr:retroviral-like aspartic protease family protein [Phenylobacterium sp.]MDX9997064.1 retroviral-like aspartic protease family protein [Phenylobacterium sp.]